MKLSKLFLLVPILGALLASASYGATITVSLPDYNGPSNSSGFPIDLGVVGTFTYSLPAGSTITSATFSGTYGTPIVSTSTAGFNAVIFGSTTVVCVPGSAGCDVVGAAFRPFSFALSSGIFSNLLTGSAPLDIVQTGTTFVRLGSPTLTINFTTVPEPSELLLLSGALAGFALLRKRIG